MSQIEDGKGRGFRAEVNDENELVVRAITAKEIEHTSGTLGDAYTWYTGILNLDAGDTFLYLRNDNTSLPLIIDKIIFNGSNVICNWQVAIGAAVTAPAGTTVTGANLNEQLSSRAARATGLSDETAVAQGNIVFDVWTPITNTLIVPTDGLILGTDNYLQIDQVTASTSGSVIVFGYFEIIS